MHQPFDPAPREIEAKFVPVSQIDIKPDIKPIIKPPSSGVTVGPDVKPPIKPDPGIMSAAFPHRRKPLSNSNSDIKPYLAPRSDVKAPRPRSDGTRPLALPVASSSRELGQVQTSQYTPRSYPVSYKTELDPDVLDLSSSSPPRPSKAKQTIKPEPIIIDLTEPAPNRVDHRTTVKREVKVEGTTAGTAVKREPSVIIVDPPTPQASVKHNKPSKVTVEPPRLPVALPHPGVKRRLGMGRIAGGYANKKFKLPT